MRALLNKDDIDSFREASKGKYDTSFAFLNTSSSFPSNEVRDRNAVYNFRKKQYDGSYAKNKTLLAFINSVESQIPYSVLSLNYFKLIADKMTDIIFNNEVLVKTGDIVRDKDVANLLERTNWVDSIRRAFKSSIIYGDSCIKTYVNGISVFKPNNCFKVVDSSDVDKVKGYVLYEYLYTGADENRMLTHIRFEVHFRGKIYECVKKYTGNKNHGVIGEATSFEYRGRVIPPEGLWYDTGIYDMSLIQWVGVNKEVDGVYGESIFQSIQDIVFAMEQRLSITNATLNNLAQPLLIIGQSCIQQDERTGEYSLKIINDKYMVYDDRQSEGKTKPEYFQADYKLDSSLELLEVLRSYLYELSEMSKSYLSGEYGGNISEETFNNTIKSAIDKSNRLITEMYCAFRDSLYCLCKLNGFDINIEDITIEFNIGRADDDRVIADICKTFIECGLYSKKTLRERYAGYNEEQSDDEDRRIAYESGSTDVQLNKDNKQLLNNDVIV